MSELDADLYGDLYGNDESEYAVPTEQVDEPVKKEEEVDEPSKLDSPTASSLTQADASVEEQKPSIGSLTASNQQNSAATSSTAPITSTSYTSQQATQQIPTYQERQDTSDVLPMNHGSASYAGQVDRPVRPSEMKEEGKMFIGGLNWDTTDEGLRKYFTQFGKVEACTIMRDAAGRSRCFAFLTFEDPASVNAVMVREHFLDGKIIDPKRAIPRQEHQRATKLFIGGLAGSVTSESMREFFSQFGKVVDATVMLDRETGRSKGFGFVSFEGVNVEPILGFGNLEIDGKLIDVKLAQPRSQREGGFQEGGNTTTGNRTGFNNNTNNNGNAYGNQGNFNASAATGTAAPTTGGNAPFDPQALATLYTRMFQQMGGMNPMMNGMQMMGGMGPGGPGFAGGMNGGMRMASMGPGGMAMSQGGMAQGMNMGMGMGTGMMARGAPGMTGGAAANMMGGVPRGPRGTPTGPAAAGVGPQRGQRAQHGYHPYAR